MGLPEDALVGEGIDVPEVLLREQCEQFDKELPEVGLASIRPLGEQRVGQKVRLVDHLYHRRIRQQVFLRYDKKLRISAQLLKRRQRKS